MTTTKKESVLQSDCELRSSEGWRRVDRVNQIEVVSEKLIVVSRLVAHHLDQDSSLLLDGGEHLLTSQDPLAHRREKETAEIETRGSFNQLNQSTQEPSTLISKIRDPELEEV